MKRHFFLAGIKRTSFDLVEFPWRSWQRRFKQSCASTVIAAVLVLIFGTPAEAAVVTLGFGTSSASEDNGFDIYNSGVPISGTITIDSSLTDPAAGAYTFYAFAGATYGQFANPVTHFSVQSPALVDIFGKSSISDSDFPGFSSQINTIEVSGTDYLTYTVNYSGYNKFILSTTYAGGDVPPHVNPINAAMSSTPTGKNLDFGWACGQYFPCNNIGGSLDTFGLKQASSDLGAAALDSWVKLIGLFKSNQYQKAMNDVQNCDPLTCDFDGDARAEEDAIHTAALYADAVATSSEGLVSETGVNPTDPVDISVFLATHLSSLLKNGISLVDWIHGLAAGTDGGVSLTSYTANEYALVVGDKKANFYDINATASIADAELGNFTIGDAFPVSFTTSAGVKIYAIGTIKSLIDPPGIGTMGIEFTGLSLSAVPESTTWFQLLVGFLVVGSVRRGRGGVHRLREPA